MATAPTSTVAAAAATGTAATAAVAPPASAAQANAASVAATAVGKHRDRAFKSVLEAIAADEGGQGEAALELYYRAVRSLEAGTSYPASTLPADAQAHILEMQQTLSRVNARIIALEQERTPLELASLPALPTAEAPKPHRPPPPSQRASASATVASAAAAASGFVSGVASSVKDKIKEVAAMGQEANAAAAGLNPQQQQQQQQGSNGVKFADVTRGLVALVQKQLAPPPTTDTVLDAAGTEVTAQVLLHIARGVKLFDILSAEAGMSGENVRLVTSSAPLRALSTPDVSFLQCSDWIFPLVNVEQCLKLRDRLYVFPNETKPAEEGTGASSAAPASAAAGEEHGSALLGEWVGVMLTRAVSDEAVRQFEEILAYFCDFRQVETPAPEEGTVVAAGSTAHATGWGSTVADKLETGAGLLVTGLKVGAEYGGALIQSGAAKLRTKIKPDDKPAVIDPKMKARMETAKEVTQTAVQVTKYLVRQVQWITDKAAERIAPMLVEKAEQHQGRGATQLHKIMHSDAAQQASLVAKAGVRSVVAVMDGLEFAGVTLAREFSGAAKETVKHKYGDEAADFADGSLTTLGNTATAALQIRRLGYKSIAKAAAKKTVIGVADELHDQRTAKKLTYATVASLPAPTQHAAITDQ